MSLREAAEVHPELVEGRYAQLAKTSDDAITALNTMLAQDGLFIHVPKGVKVERAIQVVNILRADVDLMVNRRVLIVMDEGAEAQLLFCDDSADDRNFLSTQVIEAYVGENASLDLYCLEETHEKNTRVSNVYVEQQANSRVSHDVITLHNGTTRNMLNLTFKGEGAECWCNGCVIADKASVWTTIRSSTIRWAIATRMSSINMCSMDMPWVPSPVVCWCAMEPKRPPRKRPTRTSA